MFAVSDHGCSGEQLVDTVVAVAGGRRVIAAQAVREPACFLEFFGDGLGCFASFGLATGYGCGEFVHTVGHVFGFRLADGGCVGFGDLLVGGNCWHDAGFRVGEAFGGA